MDDKHEHHTSDKPRYPELVLRAADASHRGPHHSGDNAHRAHGTHRPHHMSGSHDAHAGHSAAMFRDKFQVSLLLTIPTLVSGHML